MLAKPTMRFMGALRLALSARRPQTPPRINIRLCWQSQQCALWGLCDLPYRQDAPKPHRALIFAYVGKANNALYNVKARGRASRLRGQARFPCACPLTIPRCA